jgi:WD40 repeat protein
LDNEIQFVNLENDEVIKKLRGHYCETYHGNFSMNKSGSLIAWDNLDQINIINTQDGETVKKISDFKSKIINTAFSPSENIIAASMVDSTIKFFDITLGNNTLTINTGNHFSESLEFSPDGSLIAAGFSDSTVKFWNSINGKLIKTIEEQKNTKTIFAFNPVNKSVAICSEDGIIIWDLQTWLPIDTIFGHKRSINCVAYNQDGTLLASVSNYSDYNMILWNTKDWKMIDSIQSSYFFIITFTFHPYLKYLITGEYRTISFYEFDSLGQAFKISGHEQDIPSLAITPDGSQLISSSYDGTLKIWDLSKFITDVEIERNNHNTNNYDLELIPNPVSDILILKMNECDFEPMITISDILGRGIEIGNDKISFRNNNSMTISTKELNSGLYFLQYRCRAKVITKIFQKL